MVLRALALLLFATAAAGAVGACAPAVAPCRVDDECASFGARCVEGACRLRCNDVGDCAPGGLCVEGECARCLGDGCGAPAHDGGAARGDGGAGSDAGSDDAGSDDAGALDDGGAPASDGGADSGSPDDGGVSAADAGAPSSDAGRDDDAGVVVVDGGPPEEDGGAGGPAQWWDAAWRARVPISVDASAAAPEVLVDFPVLVRLTPSRLDPSLARPDGADVRFVDEGGRVLAHELVDWSPEGTSTFWVRVPRFDGGGFFLYAGNPAASDASSSDAWEPGFLAVWHLEGDAVDSSAHARHGTVLGAPAVVAQVERGLSFDGAGYVELPPDLLAFDQGAISLWLRTTTSPPSGSLAIAFYASAVAGNGWGGGVETAIGMLDSGRLNFTMEAPLDTYREAKALVSAADGAWHHVTAVYAPGVPLRVYVDGVAFDDDEVWPGDAARASAYTRLGRPALDVRQLVGDLDEVRVSRTPRSAGWVRAERATALDAVLTYGPAETLP